MTTNVKSRDEKLNDERRNPYIPRNGLKLGCHNEHAHRVVDVAWSVRPSEPIVNTKCRYSLPVMNATVTAVDAKLSFDSSKRCSRTHPRREDGSTMRRGATYNAFRIFFCSRNGI